MQRSRGIAHPTGIETHVDDHVLDFRQASSVAIVEQETARGTEGILAEVALSSSGRFTAFDDLVTLTVRASDGDERHGPFLPKGGYEDEAQCDSNRSPSPLLKHYRSVHRGVPCRAAPCRWREDSAQPCSEAGRRWARSVPLVCCRGCRVPLEEPAYALGIHAHIAAT